MLKSTRSSISVKSSEAIIKGLSDDGGLFVFDKLNKEFFQEELIGKSYQEIAFLVMKELLDDFSEKDILDVVRNSYNETNFMPDVVNFHFYPNTAYLNLYHGNTFAFKDLALSTLPNLLTTAKAIQQINQKTIILTATSGDTGSAALSGFKDVEDVAVIVLYPANGVSEFQELQMNFFKSRKHIVLPIDGNFDDCQSIVKNVFSTIHPTNVNLSSANSINIGRIIPQIVYYVYAYCKLVEEKQIKVFDKINITVPTGNFGNIYSAYIAKQLGVPIQHLIIASNENNVLTELFHDQEYNTIRTLHKTMSPSMDILVSSNFERYLYHLYKEDYEKVKKDMETLKYKGFVSLDILRNQTDFFAYYADEEETSETIKQVSAEENHLIDPHTAVAKCCAGKYIKEYQDDTYMLIVSTASPFKFSDAIFDIFDMDKLSSLQERFTHLSQFFHLPMDERMLEVLEVDLNRYTISLSEAYQVLERIIGDFDVEN